MKILGAGLTGCLAAYAFENAEIIEYLDQPKIHSAVLRFRSLDVSHLTGIPFKRVTVHKGIYVLGLGFVTPSIKWMNNYSFKVTGGYHDRSISSIDSSVRFIAPANFHSQMLGFLGNRVRTGCSPDVVQLGKEQVISTLPLPITRKLLGYDNTAIPALGSAKQIYVSTAKIADADVYQTVYFPCSATNIYRASVTGDMMIVESIEPIEEDELKHMTVNVFGFHDGEVIEMNKIQEHGKFIPMEDTERKELMYDMTVKHNIYSLGRHATWRKVMLDDIVQDIDKISGMLKRSAYDRMLGK